MNQVWTAFDGRDDHRFAVAERACASAARSCAMPNRAPAAAGRPASRRCVDCGDGSPRRARRAAGAGSGRAPCGARRPVAEVRCIPTRDASRLAALLLIQILPVLLDRRAWPAGRLARSRCNAGLPPRAASLRRCRSWRMRVPSALKPTCSASPRPSGCRARRASPVRSCAVRLPGRHAPQHFGHAARQIDLIPRAGAALRPARCRSRHRGRGRRGARQRRARLPEREAQMAAAGWCRLRCRMTARSMQFCSSRTLPGQRVGAQLLDRRVATA